jgi:hypothetical protein
MKYVIEVNLSSMIYIPSFMTVGSGIKEIFTLLPQQ